MIDLQKKFDNILIQNNFFSMVKNYCLKCEFFTMEMELYCEEGCICPDEGECIKFRERESLVVVLEKI